MSCVVALPEGQPVKTTSYNCEPLAELARQLLFSPPAKRVEQVYRAEELHDQVDPDVNYPFDFVSYRITGYQTESVEPTVLVGTALLPDLRLLIDQLSRSVAIRHDPDEPIETIQTLADRLNVSTKTIERYRRFGLRWRWVRPAEGGRRFIAFTADAVECFMTRHGQRGQRAGQFTQIEAADRQKLIERARLIATDRKLSLNQVARQLARESDRAVETIRLVLEQHDRTQIDQPIFPDRTGQLTSRQKELITRALRRGVPVQRLADRFGRTRSTIYRAARDRRAAQVRRLTILYIRSPDFDRDDADDLMPYTKDEDPSPPPLPRDATANLDDLPPPLRAPYGCGGMTAERQGSVLVRFNFLKFTAARLRDGLDRYEPRVRDLDRIEAFLEQSARLRRRLVEANLHLVLSVARRHLIDQPEKSTARLAELLAVGNEVLLQAIEEFDVTQKQTFDSYVTYRFIRRFAVLSAEAGRAQRWLSDEQWAEDVLKSLAGVASHAS